MIRAICSLKNTITALALFCMFFGTVVTSETPIPRDIQKIIHKNANKENLIKHVYRKYPKLTEYYSQRQGFFAIEALSEDPVAAIYTMEVFPGYFHYLSTKTSAAEAVKFFKATSHNADFLKAYAQKLRKYQHKPKLLGLLLRSNSQSKEHLITDLEANSAYLASRLVELYSEASPVVRKAIQEKPHAAFFLLETKEDGIAAMDKYGDVVASIATFYKPGERREVLRELQIGGKSFVEAYNKSSIVGWRTAVRFPRLYQRLVETMGIVSALDFLNANGHYLASHVQDPTDEMWITSVTQQVKSLNREGVLNYTFVDSFAFALCSEVEEGKELIARMGDYLPAALIYHYYPRHKTFLCRFLNRYGVAPLKLLFDYAKQEEKRLQIESIIDKYSSNGLLLATYSARRSEAINLLLSDGYDRGKHYLNKFSFDEYGIPSFQGSKDLMPDLVKTTMNYFWYGSKPTWAEFGLAVWDAVDYLHTIYTLGNSKLISQSGKVLFGRATGYTFVKIAEQESKKFTLAKLKKVALNIAWKSFKKVLRKELIHQRFNQLERLTTSNVGRRMTKNFLKTSWKYSYNIALNEFLSYAFD
ncbi:hypothetical protein [Candidatus Uabimicrobium amorphum]|uniref:Uncharacterized protein n=1 Tax=Uabimicrobium amorphum TaxID=2596890 RepID=A0A5S9IPZ9_UABAM|nr:hypothetical protein [Candidatus Uabimicrobium amorphum]BBM85939.1 hypothetical protein UABAM_04325 [Candidatus Uabimicrobium amorphum]